MKEIHSPTGQQGIPKIFQHPSDPRAGESSCPAKGHTAKAVLAVAKGMSEEATVYDFFNKTKEMGIHSDELWEWGL